jgi:hypothetical protein
VDSLLQTLQGKHVLLIGAVCDLFACAEYRSQNIAVEGKLYAIALGMSMAKNQNKMFVK